MPKYEDMIKPTTRKRTFKVVAEGNGCYVLTYMNQATRIYSSKEIIPAIKSYLKTVDSWADELKSAPVCASCGEHIEAYQPIMETKEGLRHVKCN